MRLDTPPPTSSRRLKGIYALCVVAVLLLVLPTTSAVKSFLVDKGYVSTNIAPQDKLVELLENLLLVPSRWYSAKTDLPMLKIDIKYQDWLQLKADRDVAFSQGSIPEKRNEVSAFVYHEQNKIPAKIRLQGDMLDHINKPTRWSFKVTLKNKQAIFESRRFALVAPSVRINQGASLFAKSLQVAGFDIISPKNIPVKVIVNGDDWGVMLLEQAFSQSLLATNNRTEGLIIRLDLHSESTNADGNVTRVLKPRVIQRKTILNDHSLSKQRQLALVLINDFLTNERPASDVFDASRLGQYLAMVDLWGAWHALTWNNWRWYYNPHTAKLEPIQSDVAVTPAPHIWLMQPPSQTFNLSKAMLKDPIIMAQYQEAKNALLTRLDAQIIPALQAFEHEFNHQLHTDSPLISGFDYEVMKQQARCWDSGYSSSPCDAIKPLDSQLHKQMDAFLAQSNWDLTSELVGGSSQTVWHVSNNDTVPLIIKGLEGITKFDEINTLDNVNDRLPLKLLSGESTSLILPRNIKAINVAAGLEGKSVQPFHFIKNTTPLSFFPRGSEHSTNDFPFDHFINRTKDQWVFKQGDWLIDRYLITPHNTKVIIPSGTNLTFSRDAGMMVFGSLQVDGSSKDPVTLTKTSEAAKWSGLSVFAPTSYTSHSISHMKLSYASSPKLGLWQPRGAIYFVNGVVKMDNVSISDNQSEDGLNIVNAHIHINQLSISNALSDAFDCDFCTGTLKNSAFDNIGFRSGGDGLDVSGSNLNLHNLSFNNVRDKAISAGERSQLNIKEAYFDDVNFGLVAKDDSVIEADMVTAANIKHNALMSYSKKPIFGPASMQVTQYHCNDLNCDQKNVSEIGSVLVVNNVEVPVQQLNVKNLYNTVMKSDKPR